MNHKRLGRRRVRALCTAGVALILASAMPMSAQAGPREDMKGAYATALDHFNNLDYEAASGSIESGIAAAQSAGAGQDPTLASLYVLKAALLYSNEGDEARARIVESLKRAVALNYYVVVPIEVRSDELSGMLDEARSQGGQSQPDPITHAFPTPECGGDLVFEALLGVPDGGQSALYWRFVGETDFRTVQMETFSNVATATVRADEHGDKDVEYILAAFDSGGGNVANLGTVEQPLSLPQNCGGAVAAGDGDAGDGDGDGDAGDGDAGDGDAGDGDGGKGKGGNTGLPKFFVNIGLGTGFGIARGTVETSYTAYRPSDANFSYEAEEHACAIARWIGGPKGLPDADQLVGDGNPDTPLDPTTVLPGSGFDVYAPPGQADEIAAAYNPRSCGERHPVAPGLASAPFHIAPEFGFRVSDRIVLSVFGRLQVVTGSKVFAPDPDTPYGDPQEVDESKKPGTQYWEDVYNSNPRGVQIKPSFTWAVGGKFKYMLGKEGKKFRPFVGAFGGYGRSRLRVNLGFGQDRNGNSVPDDEEIAADAKDQNGTDCFQVWPYNGACDGIGNPVGTHPDNQTAGSVRAGASGDRVDTVAIGPGFVGGSVGFNYQIHKHFALFGEFQVSGWFPDTGSVLFDLNVGPAITF